MPARTAARQRLADLMERRRLDLGLTWREVAEAGNISYEVIRAIRNGNGQIRPLSKHGIEVGLKWEAESVQRILDGGDPAPLLTLPAVILPAAPESETPGDDVTHNIMVAAGRPEERRIWAAIRNRLAATPEGAKLLSSAPQAALWPPETGDGRWGGAPVELTPQAVRVLDSTPVDLLADDPIDHAAFRLTEYPWPDRVGMAAAMRGRIGRPTIAVRRAG